MYQQLIEELQIWLGLGVKSRQEMHGRAMPKLGVGRGVYVLTQHGKRCNLTILRFVFSTSKSGWALGCM
jgi:hypothetical protein